MTTIGSLPPETIIKILKTASQFEFQQDIVSVPTTICNCSMVSGQWHSIVFQTPALFTNILIPLTALRDRNYSIQGWTSFWLKHSKALSVSVVLCLSAQDEEGDEEDFEKLQDVLNNCIIPHISRIQGFHLLCLGRNPMYLYPASSLISLLMHVDAPILKEIVIRAGIEGRMIFTLPSELPLFASAPNLQKLTVHGSDTLPILTEQLRELDLLHVVLYEVTFRLVARTCPRLEVLALRDIHLSAPPSISSSESPIEMNSLRLLTLQFRSASTVDINQHKYALTYVMALNLEYLELSTAKFGEINLANILPNPSSLTNLRKLKLVGISKRVRRRGAVSGDMDNSSWFRNLPASDSVEEIYLSHSSGEVLEIDFPVVQGSSGELRTGDDLNIQHQHPHTLRFSIPNPNSVPRPREVYHLGRSRNYDPIPLFDSTSLSPSATNSFKNLKSISVDTFVAEDMIWLCRLLTVRPNIRTVCMSPSALSTLRSSLVLLEDEETGGWLIKIQKPGYMAHRLDYVEERGIDIEEWMKRRVELLPITSYGNY